MDPLTALGVVANVLQVIDFTAKFAAEVSQFLKSTSDTLPENEWFESLAKQNQVLDREIETTSQNQQLTKLDQDICDVAKRCNAESQRLITILDPLKVAVKNGVKSKRDMVWKALKSRLVKGDEIAASQMRLERLELQLSTLLLQSIRASQAVEFTEVKELIDVRGDKALDTLRTSREEILQVLKACHSEGLLRMKANEDSVKRLEALMMDAEERERVDRLLATLCFPEMNERVDGIDERHRNSFDWMFKGDHLDDRHSDLLHRMFGKDQPELPGDMNSPFRDWLLTDEAMFWVCGEPGSGKSVLLKTLRRHPKTEQILSQWTLGKPLAICEYYFWISGGVPLQTSTLGMLRTIAHQALSAFPGLVADAKLRKMLFKPGGTGTSWTVDHLTEVLAAIASQVKLCLFIDGLDECNGGPKKLQSLVDVVKQLAELPSVKVCVSSRPWAVFEDAYGSLYGRIMLQDLTEDDIFQFVLDTLRNADPESFSRDACDDKGTESFRAWKDRLFQNSMDATWSRPRRELLTTRTLLHDIVRKAAGSFLWTALVLDALCARIQGGEAVTELQYHLRMVPQTLERYYESSILDRISDTYRSAGYSETAMALKLAMLREELDDGSPAFPVVGSSLCFWIQRQRQQPGTLAQRPWGSGTDPYIGRPTEAEELHAVSQTTKYLSGCCRGILSVSVSDGGRRKLSRQCRLPSHLLYSKVHFKHRSMLDFLQSAQGQTMVQNALPDAFDRAVDEILLEGMTFLHHSSERHECFALYRMACSMEHASVTAEETRRAWWEEAIVRWSDHFCPERRCFSQNGGYEVLVRMAQSRMLAPLEKILEKRSRVTTMSGHERSSLLVRWIGIQPHNSVQIWAGLKIPLPATELLLKCGADPNSRTHTDFTRHLGKQVLYRTVWHTFLACLMRTRALDPTRWTTAFLDDCSDPLRGLGDIGDIDGWNWSGAGGFHRLVQLIKLLIIYGADLDSPVCVGNGKCKAVMMGSAGPSSAKMMGSAGSSSANSDLSGTSNSHAVGAQSPHASDEKAGREYRTARWVIECKAISTEDEDESESTPERVIPGILGDHPTGATGPSWNDCEGCLRQDDRQDQAQEKLPAATLSPDTVFSAGHVDADLNNSPQQPFIYEIAGSESKIGREADTYFRIVDQHQHEWMKVADILSCLLPTDYLAEVVALVDEYSKPEKVAEVRAARLKVIHDREASELFLDDLMALGRPANEYLQALDVRGDEMQLQMLLAIRHCQRPS